MRQVRLATSSFSSSKTNPDPQTASPTPPTPPTQMSSHPFGASSILPAPKHLYLAISQLLSLMHYSICLLTSLTMSPSALNPEPSPSQPLPRTHVPRPWPLYFSTGESTKHSRYWQDGGMNAIPSTRHQEAYTPPSNALPRPCLGLLRIACT